jgi:hypothetical protein
MKKYTTKTFIEKAIEIHGDKYLYDKTIYTGIFNKVLIFCTICKDYYLQRPSEHLSGCGCTNCRISKGLLTKNNKYFKIFLQKSKIIHNELYNYTLVNYINMHAKVEIICNRCKNTFLQSPSVHLKGSGCPNCNKYKYTQDDFIKKAKEVHGNSYDYSKVDYTHAHCYVTIICNICGKEFKQKAYSHLQGIGCSSHSCGHSRNQWIDFCTKKSSYEPKIYIIKCFDKNEKFIKIGITTTSVHNRFRNYKKQLPYSYEILKETKGSSDFVWDKEKELHKLCRPFQYKPLNYFQGETECFSLECLELLNL